MALNRLSVNLEFQHTQKIVRVIKNIGDITVRSNLTDYNFKVSESLMIKQAEVLKNLKNIQGSIRNICIYECYIF